VRRVLLQSVVERVLDGRLLHVARVGVGLSVLALHACIDLDDLAGEGIEEVQPLRQRFRHHLAEARLDAALPGVDHLDAATGHAHHEYRDRDDDDPQEDPADRQADRAVPAAVVATKDR
jgi:hypothetical protein